MTKTYDTESVCYCDADKLQRLLGANKSKSIDRLGTIPTRRTCVWPGDDCTVMPGCRDPGDIFGLPASFILLPERLFQFFTHMSSLFL